MEQLLPAICACAICLGVWGAMAAVAGLLAHRRMVSAERALGSRAVPPDEWPYAWYAGASVVWLSALVLAIVGLANRRWARVGRTCAFLFLGHMTVATFAAMGAVLVDATGATGPSPAPLVVMACVIVMVSAVAMAVFLWQLAGARVARIEALPSEGAAPGLERWAVYAVSALAWPAGFAAAAVYGKPENVRVGANALRISLVVLTSIALATCVAVSALVVLVPLPV